MKIQSFTKDILLDTKKIENEIFNSNLRKVRKY